MHEQPSNKPPHRHLFGLKIAPRVCVGQTLAGFSLLCLTRSTVRHPLAIVNYYLWQNIHLLGNSVYRYRQNDLILSKGPYASIRDCLNRMSTCSTSILTKMKFTKSFHYWSKDEQIYSKDHPHLD